MTTQRRTFIDPCDIIGLEFECSHCHSRCSIPLAKFDRAVTMCSNCKQEWLNGKPSTAARSGNDANYSDDQLISLFVDYLELVP
jgi:hypothetical protein